MSKKKPQVAVENINVPGSSSKVDAAKYGAMHDAMLSILPSSSPGLNQAEIREQVRPHLPEHLFPGGATAGWWAKTVQLDLEAKKVLVREASKPLRWYRA